MNPTALSYALQLLTALPGLIQAGVDITRLVTAGRERIEAMELGDRPPTAEEWAELNREIARLRGELHAP